MAGAGGAYVPRHTPHDSELRRRVEPVAPRRAPPRRIPVTRKPAPRVEAFNGLLERNLLTISGVLLLIGIAGWSVALYNQIHGSGLLGGDATSVRAGATIPSAAVTKSNPDFSAYIRTATDAATFAPSSGGTPLVTGSFGGGEAASSIIAREFSFFEPQRTAEVRVPAKAASAKAVPPVRTAALEPTVPQSLAPAFAPPTLVSPRVPANVEAKTSLVDFETAPFPYRGMLPGSDRPFLADGHAGVRGHVNFRGRMFLESKTFSDDRVLLHIPQGFDPNRPAVMVVFFHGHGATLARDVRDRQRLPEQISAAGLNAVLVAPQFAVDAADSSAGKFWEAGGFKRFLDEASKKLAGLYGDQRSTMAFANMPIVLVAYSGGFGPTLSVLARGGANQRIRGLVLLDALYAGIDEFADWIAEHRSTFFISSYTPHTAHHNADLERALANRSVSYTSDLRRNRLPGMISFLPAGDVSHRDFVTHAWADYPVEDVLLRMNDTVARIDTSTPVAAAAGRN
ncbi:MAG TPA: alpha/beta hydrolase [Xanthobacteraceae bacterium]|nr:alpha/beta hydrolase [Xanthobacteraceae bacterium]